MGRFYFFIKSYPSKISVSPLKLGPAKSQKSILTGSKTWFRNFSGVCFGLEINQEFVRVTSTRSGRRHPIAAANSAPFDWPMIAITPFFEWRYFVPQIG